MPQDPVAKVRVYKLYVPTATSRWHLLIILSLGVTVGYSGAFVLILVGLGFLSNHFGLEPRAWGIECALVGASVGIVAWVLLFHWFRHWNAMRSTRLRTVRLQRLAQHPEAVTRVPHRCVELHLRALFPTRRRLGHLMKSLSPTHAFVIQPRGRVRYALPVPCGEPFEPIDLAKDLEQALWIVELQRELLGFPRDAAAQAPVALRARAVSALAAWWLRVFTIHRRYVLLVYLALLTIMMVYLRHPWLIGMLALSVAVPWAFTLAAETKWWLVPGGLVSRDIRVWRREPCVRIYTPEQTPLLLDGRGGVASMLADRRLRRCHAAGLWWVVLAGWLSLARRPSRDEIESLLGGRLV